MSQRRRKAAGRTVRLLLPDDARHRQRRRNPPRRKRLKRPPTAQSPLNLQPLRRPADGFISIDDFIKVDLRIAKIVNAEHVEGSDKLLAPDTGCRRNRREWSTENPQCLRVKSAYAPRETLIGQHTVLVANLAPRKMKFGLSEGMVLAASSKDAHNDAGLYLL